MTLCTKNIEVINFDNGLTLIIGSVNAGNSASITVHSRIGFRNEPFDVAGIAHLFEHLLFRPDLNVAHLNNHLTEIERIGGISGARTRHDYTEFYNIVPRDELVQAISLVVGQFTIPKLTTSQIQTEINVIRAEISEMIDSQPNGGFPWISLPRAMYQMWENTHNGYGDVDSLAKLPTEEIVSLMKQAYAPDNLVVTVVSSEISSSELSVLFDSFGSLTKRDCRSHTVSTEPVLATDNHLHEFHHYCPTSTTALGFRLPNPLEDPHLYRGCMGLARWFQLNPQVRNINAQCGWFGRELDAKDPDAWIVTAPSVGSSPGIHLTETVRVLLDQCAEMFKTTSEEFEQIQSYSRIEQYRRSQEKASFARILGANMLLYGTIDLLDTVYPFFKLEPCDMKQAAEYLLQQSAATMTISGIK